MSFTPLPSKLAVYYGWPSAVNASGGDVNLAAAVFKDYDNVIFGAGLEDTAHGDHANTISIINHGDMVNTEVHGYIDATLSIADVQDKIDKWHLMGVKGIFLDRFGYDFGLTREKQNAEVWSIHEKGDGSLKAYVNAWDPDDVFSNAVDPTNNPDGDSHRLVAGDTYLLESYQIINGAYQSETDWRTRSDKAVAHRTASGVSLGSVTTYDASAFDQNKFDYSYYSSVLDELDDWGWGEENFSSVSASLPFHTRPLAPGTKFITVTTQNGNVFERAVNVGIHVDTSANTVSTLLD